MFVCLIQDLDQKHQIIFLNLAYQLAETPSTESFQNSIMEWASQQPAPVQITVHVH